MKRFSWLILALFVIGCGSTTPPVEETKQTTTGTTGTTTDPKTAAEPAKTPTVADIPAELKHDGFEYYGLGAAKPLKMISKQKGSPDLNGQTEFQLLEYADGKAKFKQVFGGELSSQFPDSELILDKDGVYSINLGASELDKPQMELPAKVEAGKVWKLDKPIEASGTTISKFDSRIIGPEKITVPLGTYDAMKVTADVEMQAGGSKRTAKMTAWYAKGIGTVKLSMVFFDGKTTNERTLMAVK